MRAREAWERGPDAHREIPTDERAERLLALRRSGFEGPADRDGRAVMSRTDSHGRPLSMFDGGDGRGTPDERKPCAGERGPRPDRMAEVLSWYERQPPASRQHPGRSTR